MPGTEESVTTVLIADDHDGFRAALLSLLAGTHDLSVVGAAADGEEAVALASQLQPQVVVMDLAMPRVDGVEATRRIRERGSRPAVVALSGSRELIREAVAAGAAYTILKDEDPARMLAVIRRAAAG
jgi:DNA-binding NarL/FixJ family response regulator